VGSVMCIRDREIFCARITFFAVSGKNAPAFTVASLAMIMTRRPQTADEMARAALFLCSEQSSAITGQALNVDGGMAFY